MLADIYDHKALGTPKRVSVALTGLFVCLLILKMSIMHGKAIGFQPLDYPSVLMARLGFSRHIIFCTIDHGDSIK